MLKEINLAVAQISCWVGDKNHNLKTVEKNIIEGEEKCLKK